MSNLKKYLCDKKFLKSISILALPIAFQNLLNALLNVIDSLMVSRLGDFAMSAVLLSNQFVFIYQLIIFVIGGTASIFISQLYGKKDFESMPRYTGFSLLIGLICGVVFTCFSVIFPEAIMSIFGAESHIAPLGRDFMQIVAISFIPFTVSSIFYTSLRGIKRVKLAVFGSLVGIGLNVFFNYSLMFGKFGFPELGLSGAAWGTVISRCVELIIVIATVVLKPSEIVGSLKTMTKWDKPFAKSYFKIFTPTVMNELFWVLGTTAYFAVFARMPNSESLLAALNITQSIDKLIFVFLIGIGNATSVLIGNSLGASQPEKANEDSKKALVFSLACGILLGILNYSTTFFLPVFFGNVSQDSLNYAKSVLLVFSLFLFVRAINYTTVIGILRAGGDTKFCMILETCTIWLIAVPAVAIGGLIFNLHIAWLYTLVFSEEVAKNFLLMLRLRTGKWRKNLTLDEKFIDESPEAES